MEELKEEENKISINNTKNINNTNEIIKEVRYMIEDVCPYSCEWCAVYWYKQEKNNWKTVNLNDYWNNEWALVQNKKEVKDKYLTIEDYSFLTYIFYNYFQTRDITLTGWEALYSKIYSEISKEVSKIWAKVTVLTKWAWLFNDNWINKIKNTDRIIFSLDTLDSKEHYKLNLPLKKEENALKYLDKTLYSIKKAKELWKEITINTVITKEDNEKKFLDMINFCINNDIESLKFLELDSKEIKEPYIEEKFKKFLEKNLLESDIILEINNNIDNNKKHNFLLLKTKKWKKLTVWTYRLTCAEEHLFNLKKQKEDKKHKKACEIWKSGSITINTTWEIIPCTAIPNKKISLVDYIKNKDIVWLIKKIKESIIIIEKQKCPTLFNN